MNDLMPTMAGTAFDETRLRGASTGGAADQAQPESAPGAPKGGDVAEGLESLRLVDGADVGVTRYCERFFVSPESARSGSKALLTAFEDNGSWLSSLVQPGQLVAELRQSCCALASHVMMHWINQGETHKLARFADALLEATPPLATHEAGQIMALLASMLGILRPLRAQNLLKAALPLLEEPLDAKLREEAVEWVEIGRLLDESPPDERLLWNRRLREPEEDWEWESLEARAALKRVTPMLRQQSAPAGRFQKLVPSCWWDLLHEAPPTVTAMATAMPARQPPSRRRLAPGSLLLGVLVGTCGVVAGSWWGMQEWPDEFHRITTLLAVGSEPAASLPIASQATVTSPTGTRIPAITAQRVVTALPSAASPPEAQSRPSRTPPPAPPEPIPSLPNAVASEEANNPATARRLAAAAELAKTHPHLQRLHNLVKSGAFRENEALVYGRSSLIPAPSPDYPVFLRWLMLDPPLDEETRKLTAKLATRTVAHKDMYSVLELISYPGSPNEAQAREIAGILLSLEQGSLNQAQRGTLETLAKSSR